MSEIKDLSAAMAKAFPLIEGAVKDSDNPFFKSKYADLASVVAAIKPALSKHGLWFMQAFHDVDDGVCVETIIHHESGQSISCGKVTVPVSKQDAQGYGSAMTYARRYSLQAAFGVAPEDDDGNAAAKATSKGMAESAVIDHLTTINDATTMAELQAAFTKAFKAAGDDLETQKHFIKAKDLKKKSMEGVEK